MVADGGSKLLGGIGLWSYVLGFILTDWSQTYLENCCAASCWILLLVGYARALLDGRTEISPWATGF
jgi:hypothetical protein